MGMTDPLMTYIERQPLPPGFLAWLREVRKPSNFDEAVPDSLLNFDEVLILSTKWGQSDFTERVLKNAAVDVTAKLAGTGWTALHFAALFDRVATAEVLLKSGADVSANSDYGITPLHVATMAERMNMVEWLANNGADGNAIALNVPTPMAIALGNDRMDMVKAMWNSAYSKLEDLEKDTSSPVLSKLKEVFAGKELHIADTVFKFIRPVNFEDLKLTNEGGDSLIDLFKSHYDDLQKYVKMLEKAKEQQLQRGSKRKLLKPLRTSEPPTKVAEKSDDLNP